MTDEIVLMSYSIIAFMVFSRAMGIIWRHPSPLGCTKLHGHSMTQLGNIAKCPPSCFELRGVINWQSVHLHIAIELGKAKERKKRQKRHEGGKIKGEKKMERKLCEREKGWREKKAIERQVRILDFLLFLLII